MRGEDNSGGEANQPTETGAVASSIPRRGLLKTVGAAGTGLVGLSSIAMANQDFVEIVEAVPSNYPSAHLRAKVDSVAGRNGDITREDVRVTETTGLLPSLERPINRVNLVGRSADIVCVIDDTSSMYNNLPEVKSGLKTLASNLPGEGIDARFGLVTFKDTVEVDQQLTEDLNTFKKAVDDLTAEGGGGENDQKEFSFDAMANATTLDFRKPAEAKRIVVHVTDALSHYMGDGSGASETMDTAKSELNDAGVYLIAVAPTDEDQDSSVRTLAEEPEVDGEWHDVLEVDFGDVGDSILSLFGRYEIEYCSSIPPDTEGTVTLEVRDPNKGKDDDTRTMTPPLSVSQSGVEACAHAHVNSLQSGGPVAQETPDSVDTPGG